MQVSRIIMITSLGEEGAGCFSGRILLCPHVVASLLFLLFLLLSEEDN